MQTQRTIFDETVSSRIEALLARVDNLRRASDLPNYFTPEAQHRAAHLARKDNEMANQDWMAIAEQEASRLKREHDAGWDAACERMVDELNAESTVPPTTWEEVAEREAAKLRTGRTDSL